LQNKAVKINGGGKWNHRATPFYAKLKIRKLADLVEFEKACFIFKHKTQKLPPPLILILYLHLTFIKELQGVLAMKICFCHFIRQASCKDQLNFKVQNHGMPLCLV